MRTKVAVLVSMLLSAIALYGCGSGSLHSEHAHASFPTRGAVSWGENSHAELGAGYTGRPEGVVGVVGLPSDLKQLVLSDGNGYAVTSTGALYAWGGNIYGQLGIGVKTRHLAKAVRVPISKNVKEVAAGGTHVMALLANGTVMVWGSNLYGELGNGTTTKGREVPGMAVSVPQLVPGLSGVVKVRAGGPDDVALLADGRLMAWGENKAGQLGDGTNVEKTVPTLTGFTNVKEMAIGGFNVNGGHMLVVRTDGTVAGAGRNDQGQLGDGTTTDSNVPVVVGGLTRVTSVAADVSFSLARTGDGRALAWGGDTYGQLGTAAPDACGVPPVPCALRPVVLPLHHVQAVATALRYGVALSEGKVYAWGWNIQGELGDGTRVTKDAPTSVPGLANVVSVAAGKYHAGALISGDPPAPLLEASTSGGAVTLRWRPLPTETNDWRVMSRNVTDPAEKWGDTVILPAAATGHTLTGLESGQPHEIAVNNQGTTPRVLDVVP